MKKAVLCFLSVLLAAVLSFSAFAVGDFISYSDDDPQLLYDLAELLTQNEYDRIAQMLLTVSRRYECNVVIVTYGDIGDANLQAAADDFYDDLFGINTDGILLLVCRQDGEQARYVSTSGKGLNAVTDAALEDLSNRVSPLLIDEAYEEGFSAFADCCGEYLQKEASGELFSYDDMPKEPFPVLFSVLISLIIGLILAIITVSVMKGKLKTVRPRHAADDYVVRDSMQISDSRDLFLYHNVVRTKIRTESSGTSHSGTHTSSSGGRHGGGRI